MQAPLRGMAAALLLSVLLLASLTTGQDFDGATSCTKPQYLDESSMTCASCADYETPTLTGCICPVGTLDVRDANGIRTGCAACPSGSSASEDNTICLACSSVNVTDSASYDSASKLCVCPAQSALVERDSSGFLASVKRCVACAANAYVDPLLPSVCTPCPDPHMLRVGATSACDCVGAQWTISPDGAECLSAAVYTPILNQFPLSTVQKVNFMDLQDGSGNSLPGMSVASAVFAELFPAAAVGCKSGTSSVACEVLGNLCVLQNYDEDAAVCALFNQIADTRVGDVNGWSEWKEGMPLLQFRSATQVLAATDIASRFTFTQKDEDSKGYVYNLKFLLVGRALNGSVVSTRTLTTELHLCAEQPSIALRALRFGSDTASTCVLSLAPYLTASAPLLYDLYFLDKGNFYPVPIRLANLRVNGAKVNTDKTAVNDVFTRRFFLYDNVSGKRAGAALPDVIRVPDYINLEVIMQTSRSGYIQPPVVTIHYTERRGVAAAVAVSPERLGTVAEGRPRVLFTSVYTMNLQTFWSTVLWLFVVILALVLFISIARMYAWMRRNRSDIGSEFVIPALSYLLGVVAWLFSLFAYGIVMYWFIFFKWQADPFVLLPTSTANSALYGLLGTAFACQFLVMAATVWRQAGADIFLMDWERSRGLSMPRDGDVRHAQPLSVSIWRTLFIANEFNELQTLRRVNIEFTLLCMLVLLRGFNLDYLATPQPSFTDLTPGPVSVVLRAAVTSTFWLILVGLQILFQWAVGRRFFSNPIIDFVDLLTLSNISIFVLRERFCGYYLHGRSPHAHADVSMAEMSSNMADEASGLTPQRGLDGKPDAVTFEVFVAPEFRTQYDAAFGDVVQTAKLFGKKGQKRQATAPAPVGSGAAGSGGAASGRLGVATPAVGGPANAGLSSQAVSAYLNANRFLTSFIDRSAGTGPVQLTYSIETKPHSLSLLNLPPDMVPGRSVFFTCGITDFASVFFFGSEWALTLLNILVYVMSDIAFNNTYATLMIVYLIERAFIWTRHYLGERNIALKSLVDPRFLV